ncbi:hypothetical protein Y699_04087 [Aspergillus fumigatus Z5]|nr:hypothetical protein Y699_04087 [Aspergillus fumigatus Z5]
MKAFNILSFSLLLTIASAAAVPDVDGTITNDAGNNKRARFCGQICLNNTGCGDSPCFVLGSLALDL